MSGLFFSDVPGPGSANTELAPAPGEDGRNGVGIFDIEQVPGSRVFTLVLQDGRRLTFGIPEGLPGSDGITPEFVPGTTTYGPITALPALTPRRLGKGQFALDLVIPDLTIATQAAAASLASAQSPAVSATAADASRVQAAQRVADAAAQVAIATTQAGASAGSATAAAGSAASAADLLDQFDDRYLGPKAADPTLDNDGNALLVGALYYNTGAQPGMRVRTAAGTWDKCYAVITGGVQSFKGRDGAVVPTVGDYTATQIAGLATRSLFVSMIF